MRHVSQFFYELKQAGIPVSVKEYLSFIEAVDAGLAGCV
jgi:uncharacterized protein